MLLFAGYTDEMRERSISAVTVGPIHYRIDTLAPPGIFNANYNTGVKQCTFSDWFPMIMHKKK